jgi:hypothetical protein
MTRVKGVYLFSQRELCCPQDQPAAIYFAAFMGIILLIPVRVFIDFYFPQAEIASTKFKQLS